MSESHKKPDKHQESPKQAAENTKHTQSPKAPKPMLLNPEATLKPISLGKGFRGWLPKTLASFYLLS